MLKEMISDMKFNKSSFFIKLICIISAFIFGLIISIIIITTEYVEGSLPIGTLCSLVTILLAEIILSTIFFNDKFSLAISMGRTRKSFMSTFALQAVINQTIAMGIILMLYKAEDTIFSLLFPQYALGMLSFFIYDLRFIIAMIICPTILCMFFGSLSGWLGSKSKFILPWIFTAIMWDINYLIDGGFPNIPGKVWIFLGIAAMVLMLITVLHLGKRYMVR